MLTMAGSAPSRDIVVSSSRERRDGRNDGSLPRLRVAPPAAAVGVGCPAVGPWSGSGSGSGSEAVTDAAADPASDTRSWTDNGWIWGPAGLLLGAAGALALTRRRQHPDPVVDDEEPAPGNMETLSSH